jgi:hypothetical protein
MQIKCSLVRRFYEVLMLTKKMNVNFKHCNIQFFSHDKWISKLAKKNEQDSCLLLISRMLNFDLDFFPDNFVQSLCIEHVSYFFFFEVGSKVVPELPKTDSHWSLFCSFCSAWCMLVTFLWHLNLYSGARLCSRVPIQI